MAKYDHGEYIDLDWQGYEPEGLYVRGHVAPDEFRNALAAYCGDEFVDQRLAPYDEPRHRYGRWSRENGDEDFGNGRCVLRIYSERGRGRFPVTEAPRKRAVATA